MTSNTRHIDIDLQPHAAWIRSPEFTAARAYLTTTAPELIAMLGLDGAEIRSTDARARERENERKRRVRAARRGA